MRNVTTVLSQISSGPSSAKNGTLKGRSRLPQWVQDIMSSESEKENVTNISAPPSNYEHQVTKICSVRRIDYIHIITIIN